MDMKPTYLKIFAGKVEVLLMFDNSPSVRDFQNCDLMLSSAKVESKPERKHKIKKKFQLNIELSSQIIFPPILNQ